jgi:hypothetical protein
MKVLLVGGGRMGQRHLRGLVGEAAAITLIEPNREAAEACQAIAKGVRLTTLATLDDLAGPNMFDLAILATTASGRLEQFKRVLAHGVQSILVEKPLEQTRLRARAFIDAAKSARVRAWSNQYRRALKGFAPLLALNEPMHISVCSGAMGIGCNAIHWIDFALHLTKQTEGRLLFGEIEETPIQSGRGSQYCDYGGRGLFAFPDGSRLYLSSSASSSAPTAFSIITANQHWLVDQDADRAVIHQRRPDVTHPTYLYGKDYVREEQDGIEEFDHAAQTRQLLIDLKAGRAPRLPELSAVAPAYELLFDLLETSGKKDFRFT